MSEAEAFEQAIRANPDDGTAWRAYADWLAERDDPRGEFMQVQIALENEELPADERKQLQSRENALLAAHEREWLGTLAPFLLADSTGDLHPPAECWWGRGLLAEIRVRELTLPLARALAVAPAARFLQKLRIETIAGAFASESIATPGLMPAFPDLAPGPTPYQAHLELIDAPCLQTLQVFQVGRDAEPSPDGRIENVVDVEGLEHLVAGMPRVQELHLLCSGYDARALFALPNLTRLEVLRVCGFGIDDPWAQRWVPLDVLASNPALGSLTHLLVHPRYSADASYLSPPQVFALVNSPHLKSLSHLQLRLSDMGDEGARVIVGSGILNRLATLDLRDGAITDAGAKVFADCAATKNLRRLDLSRNHVTPAGLAVLRAAGVNAVADNPLDRRAARSPRLRAEREDDME